MRIVNLGLVLLFSILLTAAYAEEAENKTEGKNENVNGNKSENEDAVEKINGNSNIIVITREDIKKMNMNNIPDILNQLPGVRAGNSYVMLRGSLSVKVFLNGRPLNDPTGASHGGIKWDQISMNNIEKIEIIKGGGSVAYGDNSSGGVILITTIKNSDLSGNVALYGGNYKTGKSSADINTSTGNLRTNATGSYNESDGYFRNTDSKQYRAGLRLIYDFNEKYSVSPSFDYYGQKGGVQGYPDYPTYFARKNYDLYSGALIANLNKVKSNFYFVKGVNNDTDSSKNLDATIDVLKTGEELTSGFSLNDYLNLSFGTGMEYIEGKGKGSGLYGSTLVDYGFNKKDEKNTFVFISNSMQIKDLSLTINTGARGIYYSDYENVINPEAGIWFKKDKYGANLNFTMTNNTPTFLQKYQTTSTKLPNPDLTMEKSKNYGASIYVSPFNWINATGGCFFNEIRDRITYVYNFDGAGNSKYENFGRVTYKGAESSLKLSPVKYVTFSAAYSYVIAKDEETGLWMPCKPRHTLNAKLKIYPIDKMSVTGEMDYQSDTFTDSANTQKSKAHALYNGYMDYRIDSFILTFEMKNLTNRKYLMSDGLEGYPRRWLAGLKYEF